MTGHNETVLDDMRVMVAKLIDSGIDEVNRSRAAGGKQNDSVCAGTLLPVEGYSVQVIVKVTSRLVPFP